jgi:hypothetical protein
MIYSEYNIQIIINMIGKYTNLKNNNKDMTNDVRLVISKKNHFPDADR